MSRIIAVGDIHGCSNALRTLLGVVKPTQEDFLIFLGDCIDRGPDSKGVLDIIMGLEVPLLTILGNHEEMLLNALDGEQELDYWCHFGGLDTLRSFGVRHPSEIPHKYIDYIRDMEDYFESVTHFFCHAYYDPTRALYDCRWNALRWTFLPPEPVRHENGKIAIVGHTAQRSGKILDLPFLKCIDTFCRADSGWLTAYDISGKVWQASEAGEVKV